MGGNTLVTSSVLKSEHKKKNFVVNMVERRCIKVKNY